MRFKDYISNKSEIIEESFDLSDLEVNEAAFNETALEKVASIYAKLIGRKLDGGNFKNLGMETYNRKMGPGKGFRFMNEKGAMLRFNWDSKISKEARYELTSLDFWEEGNLDFTKPTKTIVFKTEFNVIEIINEIAKELQFAAVRESVNESPTKNQTREWLGQHGLTKNLVKDEAKMKDAAVKAGLGEKLQIFLGQKETNSFEEDLKATQKEFDSQVFANPETVFEDIEDVLSIVASKEWRTLVVCGMGGVGKTFHITEGPRSLKALLGPEGEKWTYHSGTKAAPFAFYKTLFQERDKIIVFDEADSLLKNPDIVMMLKPILDTSGDNMAEYMAGTQNMVGQSLGEIEDYANYVDSEIADGKEIGTGKNNVKLPSKFQFTGGMVFISNMRADKIDQAIMSRSIFIDVYLAEQDVLKRIQSIGYAKAKSKGMTNEDVDRIMDALGAASKAPEHEINYMTPEYARKMNGVTVRAFELAATMMKAGLERWDYLASMYA